MISADTMVINKFIGLFSGGKELSTDECFLLPIKSVDQKEGNLTKLRHRTDSGETLRVMELQKEHPILALGKMGSGKTSAISTIINQVTPGSNSSLVIFDFKGDYRDYDTYDESNAHIISYKGSTVHWNIFEEIDRDGDYEEIARLMFPDIEAESGDRDSQFWTWARETFEGGLRHISNVESNPNNEHLYQYLVIPHVASGDPGQQPHRVLHETFTQSSDPAVQAVASNLDPSVDASLNIFQIMSTRVGDIISGDFKEQGSFSVREYISDPEGKSLVLDMEGANTRTLSPIFRFLLDWAINRSLKNSEQHNHFILDEIDSIEPLAELQQLLSKGRSLNAQSLIGIQSTAQLETVYGEKLTQGILDNFQQQLLLQTDETDYVRAQVGKERREYTEQDSSFTKTTSILNHVGGTKTSAIGALAAYYQSDDIKHIEEVDRFKESDIKFAATGQGLLINGKDWAFGRLAEWDELPAELRDNLSGTRADAVNQIASPSQAQQVTKVGLQYNNQLVEVPIRKEVGEVLRDLVIKEGIPRHKARSIDEAHLEFGKKNGDIFVRPIGQSLLVVDGRVLTDGDYSKVTEGSVLELSGRFEFYIHLT